MGALDAGLHISLDDISLHTLMDLIEYKSELSGREKGRTSNGAPKSLSEIIKGGKI